VISGEAKEHILLINYDFPPNQGIGGRRWGKLAKGLANEGYVVHVIKARPIAGNRPCAWTDDVKHPNIQVNEIRRTFPQCVSHPGKSIWDKLLYRLGLLYLRLRVRGTIYDLSSQWGPVLVSECNRVCREYPISRIIATGAPWHLLYEIAIWNEKNLRLPYFVDFRDPWHLARIHGMKNLSGGRREYESRKQAKVLSAATAILSPDPVILARMSEFASGNNIVIKNSFLLRHFYDDDDFSSMNHISEMHEKRDFFLIVYGGDIYQEMDQELMQLRSFFADLRNEGPKVQLHIYSDARIPDGLKGLHGVHFFPSAGKSFYKVAAMADALLILLPRHLNHVFSTKFYDYLPLRKPFIVATQGGAVSEYVIENELGYAWKEGGKFPWHEKLTHGAFRYQTHFDIKPFSLTETVRRLTSQFT
jgi:hypothetical protein